MGTKKDPMGKVERLQAVADKVPNYPGRDKVEQVTRALFVDVTYQQAMRHVMRLVGYHYVVTEAGGRALMVSEGWISERQSYQAEKDFREVFHCAALDWDPATLPDFLRGTHEPNE